MNLKHFLIAGLVAVVGPAAANTWFDPNDPAGTFYNGGAVAPTVKSKRFYSGQFYSEEYPKWGKWRTEGRINYGVSGKASTMFCVLTVATGPMRPAPIDGVKQRVKRHNIRLTIGHRYIGNLEANKGETQFYLALEDAMFNDMNLKGATVDFRIENVPRDENPLYTVDWQNFGTDTIVLPVKGQLGEDDGMFGWRQYLNFDLASSVYFNFEDGTSIKYLLDDVYIDGLRRCDMCVSALKSGDRKEQGYYCEKVVKFTDED